MRKKFTELLYKEISKNKNIFLLSADLGFGLFDDIRRDFSSNFINTMSSEQLMLGIAVGLSLENKISICYSITPFVVYRPFEWIMNYLHHDNIPVKLVGGGRMDYKHLGYTHNTSLDANIISQLKNIISYRPEEKNELDLVFNKFIYNSKPCYMNLKR